MNEDEMKLREYLIILNEEHPTHKRENANFSIINLFEKQQKEIERLKNLNKNTYIRKDTIRKKLEEIYNSDTISIIELINFLEKISGE